MDVQHVASLKAAAGSRIPVAVGLFQGGLVAATLGSPKFECDVCVWQLSGVRERVVLSGHNKAVDALAFSSPSPSSATLLCSASADAILLWNLNKLEPSAGSVHEGRLLPCSLKGPVSHVGFSPDVQYLAVCAAREAMVFHTESCTLDTTLVGHSAPVTSVVFSPHHAHTAIITTSEDRTFKIWDLARSSLIYQSAIVSASPFLSATIASHQELLATGTADGKLRVYDISQGGGYKCLHECDVNRELEKLSRRNLEEKQTVTGPSVIHGTTPRQHQSHESHMTYDTPTSAVETGPAILGLFYWLADNPCPESDITSSHIREVLKQPPSLLAVTHLGLLRFNAHTLELLENLDFRDPTAVEGVQEGIPASATCSFVYSPPVYEELYCALGAMFHNTVTVLSLRRRAPQDEGGRDKQPLSQTISILSSSPLLANSPLRAELVPRIVPNAVTATSGVKKRPGASKGRHQRSVMEQPLTFKSKVKSSGYAEAPRTKMFTPKTSISGQKPQKKSSESLRKREYPLRCGPTTKMCHSLRLTDRPAAINSASYSGNGHYLACACADRATYIVKMPPPSGKTQAFVGHDGVVCSACWSHDSQWLLTCSSDRSARVWGVGHKEPLLLSLTTTMHNFQSTAGESSTAAKGNTPFAKEITSAQFYYLDKFLILTSGNLLYLYKYHIDTTQADDIKRYQSKTRYKLVRSFEMQSAQTITATSCVNDFHSYIVLVGCSNKALEVYDMNVGQSIRTVTDVHTRPVHCLAQNKGSRYVTHPPDAYDLFLTSAVTDGIKLWDLRSNRCVCRFSGHHNQSHSVSATFSPCARFIATGSEDRSAYIYDIRNSSPLHKLTGHSDVVTSVTYHPMKPMLAATTLDGQITFFLDEAVK